MPRTLKRHDTADPITGTASDANGPADLTIYATIKFQAKLKGTSTLINGTAVAIESETDDEGDRGKFRFEQEDTDVSVLGVYDCELECILSNGKKVHFPSKEADNPDLTIEADLDNA